MRATSWMSWPASSRSSPTARQIGDSVRLTLATRRSPLAMAQTEAVGAALAAAGHQVTLLPLVTTGDRWSATGGEADKGMFVQELEQAVLDGRADLAVHSAKDLPIEMAEGLTIAAVPPRADPRDLLIGPAGGLPSLPAGGSRGHR